MLLLILLFKDDFPYIQGGSLHPDDQGDITNFDIRVKGLFQKPLTRQKIEAIKIQSSRATHRMNSKAEHRQPAMLRVTMTRENDDPQLPRQAGQRRRGS